MTHNLKSGLVGILSAGLIGTGLSGCTVEGNKTTYGPAFFGALAGVAGANAKTLQGAAAGAIAKDAFYLQANMDNQRKAAELGRSQVVVNNYASQSPIQPARVLENQPTGGPYTILEMFPDTLKPWEDTNGNKMLDTSTELVHAGYTFKEGESFGIGGAAVRNQSGREALIAIFPEGRNVASNYFRIDLEKGMNAIMVFNATYPNGLSPGRHRVIESIDGKTLKEFYVTVVPK